MLNYWTERTLENSHCEVFCRYCKFCPYGSFFLCFGVKGPLHELERWKAWRNSSLLAQAQTDSSVCRSNRWPWSWVARKLIIKYFNSDWFGNLRFIKSRVKSFVIQIARCLNSPYFCLVNIWMPSDLAFNYSIWAGWMCRRLWMQIIDIVWLTATSMKGTTQKNPICLLVNWNLRWCWIMDYWHHFFPSVCPALCVCICYVRGKTFVSSISVNT